MRHLEVTYEIPLADGQIEAFARDVLLEQTFETPREVVERYPDVAAAGAGSVEDVREVEPGRYRVRLGLPAINALDEAQALNAVFGNAAIHPGMRLVDLELPAELALALGGPNHGTAGIRDALGIFTRPLTATALKPAGISLKEIARLCRDFAESGIDVIKDDHYLSDQPAARFEERVQVCADIAAEASARHGRTTWYVPSLSGTPADVERRLSFAAECGISLVMVAPMTIGLPTLAQLKRQFPGIAFLAHPSFSPMAAFAPEVLWGKLFRLYGADAVIFVNAGGRFAYSREVCRLVAANLSAPMYDIPSALPVPAGGVDVKSVPEVIRTYGNDCMLLVGGSLLRAQDRRDAARRFVDSVAENVLLVT